VKVVFITRCLEYGGAERQLVLLAKGLLDRGHQPVVVVFYPGGPLQKKLVESGVPVRPLDKSGRWDVLRFLARLIRVLRQERPDVIHGYLFAENLLAVLLKPLLPSTKIVWGVRNSGWDLSCYDWLFRVCFRLSCWFSKFPDAIIANSYVGRDYHLSLGYPDKTMLVIPNGIDTVRFCPDSEARRRIRSEWGVAEHETLIGIVGRLAPMKDHPTFLRMAALLMRDRKNVRFVCVGDGPLRYRAKLQVLADTLGLTKCVRWIGARHDIPAVYNALDLAVSSSDHGEGIANVVAEAMACGVSCVVTNVGDSAWIVGDTGKVVPTKDPPALKNAIESFLDGPKCNPVVVRQRIIDHLSTTQLVVNTERVLSGLLQSPVTQ
jgi:glycosyltransferase involved in cell wall biosynthesis